MAELTGRDHQGAPAPRGEVQRLAEERDEWRRLCLAESERAQANLCERDAVRAELAAATAGGLGLPQVAVRRGRDSDGTEDAWLTLVPNWQQHYVIDSTLPLWLLRERAAVALALVRDALVRIGPETKESNR